MQADLGAVWTVVDRGNGGYTSAMVLNVLNMNVIYPGNARYACVLAGINDIINGVDAATIETNLQAIYTALHAAGIKVIALTLTPFNGSTSWSAGRQTILDTVNAWIAATAIHVDDVVDTFAAMEDGANPDTLLAAYASADWLHFTTAGYEHMADTVYAGVAWSA